MAFERIGLGAVLTFDGTKFQSGIKKPETALVRFTNQGNKATTMLARMKITGLGTFRALGTSMRTMSAGFGRFKSGLLGIGLAFAPLTLGVAAGAKKFANFEQQMSAVKAVSSFTTDQFVAMRQEAKRLGATTAFTATEAGAGFELLSRAGFNFEEQMGAIGGVLSLAAADSIELSTAASITANVVKAMGLEAKDASRVVDVLAQTSANANTDVTALGESFKFAAPIAKTMGISLEDTSIALGLIANAGLKGTLAGNSFKNMLIKLAKPTSKGKKLMKEFGIQVFETAEGNLDLRKTMESVIEGTEGITSKTKKAGVVAEIFGLRGQGAIAALGQAIDKGDFDRLATSIDNAQGAADRMAETRLDNFLGQVTLLKSAAEGFAIEFFEPFVTMAKFALEGKVIPFLQDVVTVLQELADPTANVDDLRKKFGAAASVAFGVADAIGDIRFAIDEIILKVREWGAVAKEQFGGDTLRKVIKFITIFTLVAAVLGPIILLVIGIGFAVTSLASIVTGLGLIMGGAFLPVLVIGGAIFLLFQAIKKENESLGATAMRVWTAISGTVNDLWVNVLQPLWAGFSQAAQVILPELQAVWQNIFNEIKATVQDLFNTFGIGLGDQRVDWQETGLTIAGVIGAVLGVLGNFIKVAIKVFKIGGLIFLDFFLSPFLRVSNLIVGLVDGFRLMFSGEILGGFKRLGSALLNFVLSPMKTIIRAAIRLADAVGISIPDAVRDFANEKALIKVIEPVDVGKATVPGTRGTRGAPPLLKESAEVTGAAVTAEAAKAKAQDKARDQEIAARTAEDAARAANKGIEDKLDGVKEAAGKAPCIDNNISVAVDNETIARGQSRHDAELKERSGFNTTPWQRRTALEFGSAPVRGRGG